MFNNKINIFFYSNYNGWRVELRTRILYNFKKSYKRFDMRMTRWLITMTLSNYLFKLEKHFFSIFIKLISIFEHRYLSILGGCQDTQTSLMNIWILNFWVRVFNFYFYLYYYKSELFELSKVWKERIKCLDSPFFIHYLCST